MPIRSSAGKNGYLEGQNSYYTHKNMSQLALSYKMHKNRYLGNIEKNHNAVWSHNPSGRGSDLYMRILYKTNIDSRSKKGVFGLFLPKKHENT